MDASYRKTTEQKQHMDTGNGRVKQSSRSAKGIHKSFRMIPDTQANHVK